MDLPILKQGMALIAPLPTALSDTGWKQLRDELLERVARHRSHAVVIDVSTMDVMDSYATRVLDGLAKMLHFRGASTVVVGISPGIAFAMTQLGLKLSSARTAPDLDEAPDLLAPAAPLRALPAGGAAGCVDSE